jgi:NAD(P)-dependent dehydrogenase (short-subunit alcohol dehydrogenase family)
MAGVILVTGASSGIGAATALLAAERGYDVAINFNSNRKAAEDVAARCRAVGSSVLLLQGDVGQVADVARIFAMLDAELGPLTALVNNAGFSGETGPITDITPDRLRRVFEVNVFGSFWCAQEAVRRMSTTSGGQGGAIVNISSKAALLGAANLFVDYAASKGAIDTFTKGLAEEVAPFGIRVNGLRPGIIITDFHAKAGQPDRVEKLQSGIPMRRAGTAAEVAEAVLWLLSDQASYVTGTTFDVSGGR